PRRADFGGRQKARGKRQKVKMEDCDSQDAHLHFCPLPFAFCLPRSGLPLAFCLSYCILAAMREEFEAVYDRVRAWCRARDYAGHDPFDALNSRLFQSTPLRRLRLARLAWTQLLKRSPFNLRALALVPAERNPKGTALFALALLARLRATRG